MIELMIAAGALIVVEVGLLIEIRLLTNTLKRMDDKIKKFENRVANIEGGIAVMAERFKEFTSGELKVQGDTPIGKVDVELSLKKNGVKKVEK